jgi:hypothetical protein
MKISAMALTLSLVAGVPLAAGAQTAADLDTQVTAMNSSTSNHGQAQVIGRISNDFSSFLGPDATSVVTGLRTGTPISLNSTTAPTTPGGLPVTTTTMITPPTGQMGFGNVYISLALAKQQLSTMGITQPTPEQLQAALTGGTVTYTAADGTMVSKDLQGVLSLRSEGMGWGQIAKQLDTKVGSVMSQMKSANKNFTSTTTKATATTTTAKTAKTSNMAANSGGKSSSHGSIVSASGKSQSQLSHSVSPGKSGQGIVSAAGKGNAYGHGHGNSIVTGSGSAAGTNGGIVSAGGGKGMSQVKGHGK